MKPVESAPRPEVQARTGSVRLAGPAPASSVLKAHAPARIRHLGLSDYATTYEAMRSFTAARTPQTPDELWIVQHPPIYTVGIAGRPEHFPVDSAIPLVRVDRGGQVTYHGPGQAVVYVLLDIARRELKVRELVNLLEQAAIDTLDARGVRAERISGAPGVYVDGAKIAALGLRVRAGRCYHGIALNVAMDLAIFLAIDPCGYPGLKVTQVSALGIAADADELGAALAGAVARLLGENHGS